MSEEWKQVVGYEGLYEVSNKGRVKGKNGIRKAYDNGNGYMKVTLSKDGVERGRYIHRLVAEAFIPNRNNYRCVNHKDECKNNNNVDNLEWCSHKYNNNYGTKCERVSRKRGTAIVGTDLATGKREVYRSITYATKLLGKGYRSSNINEVLKGNRKTAFGRTWEYA